MNSRMWVYIATAIAILVVLCIFSGCQQTMTKAQWEQQYIPADVNAANAKVVLETGLEFAKQKVAAQASIDWIKLICVVGCIASIAAIFLGTSTMKGLGFSALAICLASIALIQFYQTWPTWFAYAGGGIALVAGGIAIWSHRQALSEVVGNVNGIKSVISDSTVTPKSVVSSILDNQSSTTKSLVSSIRAKL